MVVLQKESSLAHVAYILNHTPYTPLLNVFVANMSPTAVANKSTSAFVANKSCRQ